MRATGLLGCGVLVLVGCGGVEPPEVEVSTAALQSGFGVDFSDCTEFAGVGFIPGANARAVTPAVYTPAGDASTGVIVVRVASCADVSVDGSAGRPTIVSQIGVNLVPPDGTGDINNYAVWYQTDNALLAARFKLMGAGASIVPRLDYSVTLDPGGTTGWLRIESFRPRFVVEGPVVVPSDPAVPFEANWWDVGRRQQQLKSNTPIPAIQFSSATTTLTTPAGSELADLIGGTSLSFPGLDSYNAFPEAHMEVRFTP